MAAGPVNSDPALQQGIGLLGVLSPNAPAYLDELGKLVSSLPSNFGAARQQEAAKGGDPLPFTTRTDGKQTSVYFPADITGIDSDAKEPLAVIAQLCYDAKFSIIKTARQFDIKEFSNSLIASSKALLGAFYCLKRDEIAPTTNIPKQYATGWEYAQWYAFTKATNELDYGDYMGIPRRTQLLMTEGAVWSKQAQFASYQRISVLVRLISQQMGHKVKTVSKFLKGEGYFTTRFVGKKPFGGLLLQEEFDLLTKEWERRESVVKSLYKKLDTNLKLPCMAGQFKQYMAQFNVGLNGDAKKIEETSNSRVPQLLVSSGKGRNQQPTISKGGNLPEKLANPQLKQSVRTVGRVMWSPLMKGVSQNQFIDLAIKLARLKLHPDPNISDPDAYILVQIQRITQDTSVEAVVQTTASSAASVYLEIYPDYAGINSWDAAFGSV